MPFASLVVAAIAFLAAFVVGTFVEYAVHRLMHRGRLLGKIHAEHHRDGVGQGWFGEFWDYFVGTVPLLAAGGLVGWLGLGSVPAAAGSAPAPAH